MILQQAREVQAGELAALVSVEDGRCAVAVEGFLHRFLAEICGQDVGQPPRQDPAPRPVDHGEQRSESSLHRDGDDVRRPHVMETGDRQMAQQVGIDRMRRMPLAGVGLAIQGVDAHPLHQRGHAAATDRLPVALGYRAQPPAPCKRQIQMSFAESAHQCQIVRRHRAWLVGGRRACQFQNLALPHQRECVGSVDHPVALSNPALVSALSKKIIFQRELPNLCVEDLEIWHVRRGLHAAKHVDDPRQHVQLLVHNLGGVHAKLCRQLRQHLAALERGESHLRIECRPMIASGSLHRLAPLVRPPSGASVKQGYHLAHCQNFLGPLS